MNNNADDKNLGTSINIEDCRAAQPVAGVYAECLRNGPNTCEYALPFGYCFLCHHPRLEEILEHTAEVHQSENA